MLDQKHWTDKLRMLQWLLLSLIVYAFALLLGAVPVEGSMDGLWPPVQTLLTKVGGVNLGAYLGYWIGRTRLGRLTKDSSDLEKLAHAIVIGLTMYTFGAAI
jgi:hypothetical protein